MTLAEDLRLGMRLLVRSPGSTAIAALPLGLGIGINTLIFSGVNSILLKEVPVNDPARLVAVEVVGVARDSDYNGVAEERQPLIYTALSQVYAEQVSLIVRSAQPAAALGTVQREVQRMDRQLPLLFVTTMSEAIRQSLFLQRFGAGLLGFFGGLAFVLAIVGVYGVMAYSVSRRTRELGIRMALGASRPTMVREVLGQGARLAVVGAVIGVAVSLLLARVVSSLLYGVGAADPVTFIGVPAALVVAALTASYLPARRAAAIDPLVALRHE